MVTYDSLNEALANEPIGSTFTTTAGGGTTVDTSSSEYELIGDQEPLCTAA